MGSAQPIENVFRALGHPVRRAVMQQLIQGEASVGTLAEPFNMALPSFMRHLRVLEDSGLLESEKVGRDRMCRPCLATLQRAESWMQRLRMLWERRLDRLENYVEQLAAKEATEEKQS